MLKPESIARLCLLAGILLAGSAAQAEIYKYEDRAGNLHFTDKPIRGGGYRLLWKSKPTDRHYGSTHRSRIDLASLEQNRRRYSNLINQVAVEHQLRPELLHAVVHAESAYDPRALSRAGARGLMQLMPATARRFGVRDSWDPEQNLSGGARYLRELLEMFEFDLKLALAAYNAGENAVKRSGNNIPPFPETQTYVGRVLNYYRENRLNQLAARDSS